MAEPLTLIESEARAIVRLLAHALTPDDGRAAKTRRLMDGLCEMVDADAWFWLRTRVYLDGRPPANIDFLHGHISANQLAVYADRSLEVRGEPPENAAVKWMVSQGRHLTRARQQVVPEAVWRRGDCADYVQRFGFDSWVYSVVPLPETGDSNVASIALVLRKLEKSSFTDRECRLIHILTSECDSLHAEGLDVPRAEPLMHLSPGLRTVLALLIEGMSAKQVAHHLDLSLHTVQGYIKSIYRHFHVQSRAELLRRFMTGDGGDTR